MKVPQRPPDLAELILQLGANYDRAMALTMSGRPVDTKGRYLHWEEMRSRTPPET